MRVTRSALAVLKLHEADLGHEAAPIARTILHHAAALCWLANDFDGATDAVRHQHAQKAQQLASKAMERAWDLSGVPSLPKKPRQSPPAGIEYLERFEKLCEEFGMRNWYVPYLVDSAFVHPSATGADAYLRLRNKEVEPCVTPEVEEVPLHSVASWAGIATTALAEITGDTNINSLAGEISELLNVDLSLPRGSTASSDEV